MRSHSTKHFLPLISGHRTAVWPGNAQTSLWAPPKFNQGDAEARPGQRPFTLPLQAGYISPFSGSLPCKNCTKCWGETFCKKQRRTYYGNLLLWPGCCEFAGSQSIKVILFIYFSQTNVPTRPVTLLVFHHFFCVHVHVIEGCCSHYAGFQGCCSVDVR